MSYITNTTCSEPNFVVALLTLLLRIWDVPGTNLAPDTGYLNRFCNSPQSFQVSGGSVP